MKGQGASIVNLMTFGNVKWICIFMQKKCMLIAFVILNFKEGRKRS